jgi:hypothetical protein
LSRNEVRAWLQFDEKLSEGVNEDADLPNSVFIRISAGAMFFMESLKAIFLLR